jgi:hypothetical protein
VRSDQEDGRRHADGQIPSRGFEINWLLPLALSQTAFFSRAAFGPSFLDDPNGSDDRAFLAFLQDT